MKKSKSNPWMRSKALYVIPVAALALSVFATPKFVAPIEETVTNLEGKGTEKSPNLQVLEQEKKPVALKDKAQSPAGKFTSEEVKEQDIDAQPLIVLNGKIFEIPEKAKDINRKRMDQEQLTKLLNINVENIESITVLQKDAAIAKWGDKGSNGAIEINTRSEQRDDESNIKADSIYNVVKERAQFPGGDQEIFKFLSENVRYPKLCHEFGVQGRVIVTFVIEKDGSISNIKKSRGPSQTLTDVTVQAYKKEHPDSKEQLEPGQDLGELLFEEAKRVLELMPKWEPAKDEDGNVVRSRFTLPFIFRLN